MPCTCQRCGRTYFVDLVVPDSLWREISPKKSSAGMLCGCCMMEMVEQHKRHGYFIVNEAGLDFIGPRLPWHYGIDQGWR